MNRETQENVNIMALAVLCSLFKVVNMNVTSNAIYELPFFCETCKRNVEAGILMHLLGRARINSFCMTLGLQYGGNFSCV